MILSQFSPYSSFSYNGRLYETHPSACTSIFTVWYVGQLHDTGFVEKNETNSNIKYIFVHLTGSEYRKQRRGCFISATQGTDPNVRTCFSWLVETLPAVSRAPASCRLSPSFLQRTLTYFKDDILTSIISTITMHCASDSKPLQSTPTTQGAAHVATLSVRRITKSGQYKGSCCVIIRRHHSWDSRTFTSLYRCSYKTSHDPAIIVTINIPINPPAASD